MSRVIVITSGKGGVGKTTTAINLGVAINKFKGDVLVIDGNLTTPNIGLHLNSPEVPVNLNHVLSGKSDVFESVYEHESGIKVIPASLAMKELKKTKSENLKEFKKDFEKVSDYVIIDSAAGLGNEASSAIDAADEVIIVTNPEIPAITDALKAIKLAEQKKKSIIGIIVTRVRRNKIEMQPDTVKDMLEIPILGMIPEDISIQKSLNKKDSVVNAFPKSKAARAYKEIASKIVGSEYNPKKDRENIFKKIAKAFGWS
jgi:septum site-determining protein MinD